MFSSMVIGNLGSDAEIVSSNGAKFVALSIASSVKRKRDDGTEVTETTWIEATLNNTELPIIPYLKAGVKVAVYGYTSLRVYSSKKDRCMKAGAKISVLQIELCGGSNDEIPRQLVDPDTSVLYDVKKYYWCPVDTRGMKKEEKRELLDTKGNLYQYDHLGFVTPVIQEQGAGVEQQQATEEQK